MKILLINSFLYNRGGDCTYMFALSNLLKANGHKVFFWGMKHPRNFQFKYEEYFVDYIDYVDLNKNKKISNMVRVLGRSIYSKNAKNKIDAFLDYIMPDIVHLNNIHAHLTPSIINAIYKKGIPMIWTLHDFKLLCPNTHFLSHGLICEKCIGNKFYNCLINTCKKDSFTSSLIPTIEAYTHKFLKILDKIDLFICPSKFLRDKFIEFNWPPDKLIFLRNFLENKNNGEINYSSNFILYFGGLVPWKGIKTLIDSMKLINSGVKLKIVGDGQEKTDLITYARQKNLSNIEFCGYLKGKKLDQIIHNSLFTIVPSECYENCSYSIMESFSHGKPVIASNIGGNPELIEDGKTGLLFTMRNSQELGDKINWLLKYSNKRIEYSKNALNFSSIEFDNIKYYNKLLNQYNQIIK